MCGSDSVAPPSGKTATNTASVNSEFHSFLNALLLNWRENLTRQERRKFFYDIILHGRISSQNEEKWKEFLSKSADNLFITLNKMKWEEVFRRLMKDWLENDANSYRYIDGHLHLFGRFSKKDTDISAIVEGAKRVGVETLVAVIDADELPEALEKTKDIPQILFQVGYHPTGVPSKYKGETDEEYVDRIAKNLTNCLTLSDKIIGFGETGFELQAAKETEALQKLAFRAHLKAANENPGISVNIHARGHGAFERLQEILPNACAEGNTRIVIHSCGFGKEQVESLVGQVKNVHFSYSGIFTFQDQNGPKIREGFRFLWKNYPHLVLIETDAPKLGVHPFRKQLLNDNNLPAYLPALALQMAAHADVSLETMADRLYENFFAAYPAAQALTSGCRGNADNVALIRLLHIASRAVKTMATAFGKTTLCKWLKGERHLLNRYFLGFSFGFAIGINLGLWIPVIFSRIFPSVRHAT